MGGQTMPKMVLVADDTKNIRTLLTTCLKLEGYEVDTAADGNEAFQMLITNKYDLAFIDIKMPEMTGTELLRRINQIDIKTQIIIMTAFATVKNAIDCTKMGAVLYIQKPFSANKVRTILGEINLEKNMQIDEVAAVEINNNDIAANCEDLCDNECFNNCQISEQIDKVKHDFMINQDNPDIYSDLGQIYEKQNQHEKADLFYRFSEQLKLLKK
jgi:DNA-binding NtrC family response regulator